MNGTRTTAHVGEDQLVAVVETPMLVVRVEQQHPVAHITQQRLHVRVADGH